jgi:hypothetical protein
MKTMKQLLLGMAFMLVNFSTAFAQVGINNTAPKATLDVTAKSTDGTTAEGIIAPRLTGDQIKAADGKYGADQTGTLVYATAAVTTSSAKTINITSAGYYYYDGAVGAEKWLRVANPAVQQTTLYTGSGSLSGPTTVTQGTNDLSFQGPGNKIFSGGRVGIGTTTPTADLEVSQKTTTPDGSAKLKIASKVGQNAVQQQLIFETHNRARGGGTFWTDTDDVNRKSFLGRPYLGGNFINRFVYRTTTTGQDIGGFQDDASVVAQTTRFMVDELTGNFGIGTETPGRKLDVAGVIASSNGLFGEQGNGPDFTGLMNRALPVTGQNYAILQGTDGTTSLNSSASKPIIFRQNNEEKMRLGVNSNFGIGTIAPTSKLQVVGLGAYASDAAAGAAGLTAGAFYQTNGAGAGIFANIGVLMVKQ